MFSLLAQDRVPDKDAKPTPPQAQQPAAEAPKPAPEAANVLGRTNAQAGEARRNENVFITALDNNTQKESNIRLGTTATLLTEFNSATRYFGAEFGVAPSGGLHLSPGRASQNIHGLFLWTHANSIFSARSFFQVGDVLPARENVFSSRVSMGLWKNAFLSLDGDLQFRSGFVNGNILVPRANERSCLSPDPRVCDLINRWYNAWPLAQPNRTDINERALNTNAPQALNTQTTGIRLDQSMGKDAKHRFFARHTWTNQALDAFQLVAGQNPDTTTKNHDARLTWTYARNAKEVWDLSAAFQRTRSLLVPEPNAVGPQVQVGTAFEKLGPGSSIPVDRVQNRYALSFRHQHTFTRHTLSFGGTLSRLHFNGREASSNRGNYFFRNDFGRTAIENFRLGFPSRYSFGFGELARGFRRWDHFWFVQDTWRVKSNLTISAGLRYHPQLGMNEVQNLTQVPYSCDCNNLAPNFGLAWRPSSKLGVFRAAYATQFGEVFPATLQQLRWNPPSFQKIENLSPPFLDPLAGIVFDPNARAIVFTLAPGLQTPYSHQYSFSWQTPLPAALGRLDLGYVGSRTLKLLYMQYFNRGLVVPGIPQSTATVNDRRPDPRYYDYRVVSNMARSYFDAARITYSLQTRRGLNLETSYWFSKAIDTGATYVNIAAGDDAMQGHSQSAFNVEGDLKGLSAFDQSHAFVSRLAYEAPWKQRILRDWRLSTVFLAKSGIPFNIVSGADSPGVGNVDGVQGDRPNIVDPSILGRTISHPDISRSLLPRSAFANIAPTDPRGNLGVNAFRRAGFRNLNASLERRFSLRQDRAFRFRAEALNALNTPQFAEPIADFSNPAFGQITNTLNDGRALRFSLAFEF